MNRKERRHHINTPEEKKFNWKAQAEREHARDVDEMILWELHNTFGFGINRLKRFYKNVVQDHRGLVKTYEVGVAPIIHDDLIKMGVDIEKWEKEFDITYEADTQDGC